MTAAPRPVWYLDAFGLRVQSDRRLPGATPDPGTEPRQRLALRGVQAGALPSPQEPRRLRNLQAYDGSPFAMLEGAAGDVLFVYGRHASFHLSADHAVLRYAASADADADADADAGWQRVLLDTILWTVSLLRGHELLHASAVETRLGTVALVAAMGGGKSSLAAELVRRGALLFSDDIVAMEAGPDTVIAFPGPPVMNLPRRLEPGILGATNRLGDFGDERWVAVAAHSRRRGPLAAAVLVRRAVGEPTRCAEIAATSLSLLPHAVSLPHLDGRGERARSRFELFGTLAASTQVLALGADPSVPADELAELVTRRLRAP